MDREQQAIEACSCPRDAGEPLAAPRCRVEGIIDGAPPLVFVSAPPALCRHTVPGFGKAFFCTCRHRASLYKTYAI